MTARQGPVPHSLVIDSEGYSLSCPVYPADTDKWCAVVRPCPCGPDVEEDTPCSALPDAGPHRLVVPGDWIGVLDAGCWLLESPDTPAAVAALALPAGRYLVVDRGDEGPQLEVVVRLGAAPPVFQPVNEAEARCA